MGKPRSRTLVGCAIALVLAGVSAATAAAPAVAQTVTQTIAVPSADAHLAVTYRGNGHGHGLSQYGALGAAAAGLKYPSILFFYYPRTTLRQASAAAHIRVLLSNTGTTSTVAAAASTFVTGVRGALPTSGIAKYRLIADGASGLTLQKLASGAGAKWQRVQAKLPNNAAFQRTHGSPLRLYLADGTSTSYFGMLRAVRVSATGASAGVDTVNRVSYDNYTQGVVPREMPTSWDADAVDAQAVAARTYGDFAVHNPISPSYDICDSSNCQVYGGHVHFNRNGTVAWRDYPPAAADTRLQILNYRDAPVFAQFSASNGGWTVAGGEPYLVAKQDPYDIAKYDPYINKKFTVTVKSLAARFGLTKLTKLVLVRDGNGTWGGRVLTVSAFNGTKRVDKDGSFLQGAFGLGTTWLQITPTR